MRRMVAAVVLAGLALACGSDDDGVESDGGGGGSLAGRTFLSSSSSRPLIAGTQVRLTFHDDGRLTASAGCNTMGGPVEVEADRIVVGDLSMTEIGCDAARHEQDEWLAGFLAADPAYVLGGSRLRRSSDGTVIELVDREVADPDRPLEGTVWSLDGIVDGEAVSSVPAGAGATVSFGSGRVRFAVEGCNQGEGPVEIRAAELVVGRLTVTDTACSGSAADVEAAVVAVLEGSVAYEIEASSLTLEHPSGKGLMLRAR